MKKEKGITIIALVVTIIIMLLLAGISIGFLSGDNGLITKVVESIEVGKIEEYRDVIELDRAGTEVQAGIRDLTNKEYMDNYEGEIRSDSKDGNLKDSSVRRKDDDTVRVVTPEGYVFDATKDGVEYVGKQGEDGNILPPEITGGETEGGEIKEGNTKFKYDPSGWTNGNVEVSIETTVNTEGFTMLYAVDNMEIWRNYTGPITITEYGQRIYAKLVNELDESRGYATGTVLNIDRKAPTVNTELTATASTTSSITLSTEVTDTLSGLGKIVLYYKESRASEYKKLEKVYQTLNEGKTGEREQVTKTEQIAGLNAGKKYNIYAEVYDVAGNMTRSPSGTDTVDKETMGMPEASTITINPNTTDWTKEDVTFTITTTADESVFKIQSSTDTKEWTDYSESKKPSLGANGIMYARLVEIAQTENVSSHASLTVSKIDKTAPTVNTDLKVTASTTSSVSLNTTVTDTASGLGKIIWYYKESSTQTYSKLTDSYQGAGATAGSTSQETKSKTITGLSAGKTYNTYAEVYDVSGNMTRTPASGTIDRTTTAMSEVGTITLTPNNTNWTKDNVSVTITTTANTSIFKLQYSTTADTTWKDYASPVTMTANGTVYARLVEKAQTGNISSNASTTLSKIDKTAPTVNTALSVASTTSSITLSTAVTDGASGLGKIIWYYKLSSDSSYKSATDSYQGAGATAGTTSKQNKTKSFTGLSAGKTYNTYAEVYDVAGNMTRTPTSGTTDKGTTAMPATSTITITPSTTGWTNQDVTFKITTTADANTFKLQYSTNASSGWTDYTSSTTPKLTANGTMYARLVEKAQTGNISSNASSTISKIDKGNPEMVSTSASGVTWSGATGTVTLTGKAKDTVSGIKWYQFSTSDKLTKDSSGWKEIAATTQETTQTSKVTSGGTWYFYVKDQAQNVNKKSVSVTISDTTQPTISLSQSTTNKANSLTLTGKSKDTGSGLVGYAWVKDSTSAPSSWKSIAQTNSEITQQYTVESNGTYYFWTKDGVGKTSVTSLKITNIATKVTAITSFGGATLLRGNTTTLSITYTGEPKSISYTSNNASLASINSNRLVTASSTSTGSATMTVTITNYDGSKLTKTSTVQVNSGAARVNNKVDYASLKEAINATTSGTIQLLTNRAENVSIASGKTITLDLNGKTLSATSGDVIANRGTLTISNGTVSESNTSKGKVIANWSKLIINSGTYQTSASEDQAFWQSADGNTEIHGGTIKNTSSNSGWGAVNNEGTLSIGGTTTAKDSSSTNITINEIRGAGKNLIIWRGNIPKGIWTSGGNITVNGGTITGGAFGISVEGSTNVTVTGGTVSGTTNAGIGNSGTGKIEVKGSSIIKCENTEWR